MAVPQVERSPLLDVAPLRDPPEVKVPSEDLLPFLTCFLCKGYLVNATTITECLHTFCKSCLVRHALFSLNCPKCNNMMHPSDPFSNMRLDSTWQDILYKVLPNIEKEERDKEMNFYKSRGIPWPLVPAPSKEAKTPPSKKPKPDGVTGELISVHLQYAGTAPQCGKYKPLMNRFIVIPGKTSMHQIETFLAVKMGLDDHAQAKLFMDSYLLHDALTLENVREIFYPVMKKDDLVVMRYGIIPAGNWFQMQFR